MKVGTNPTKVFCNQKQKIIQHDWNIYTHFYSRVCKSYKQIDMTNIKTLYKRSKKNFKNAHCKSNKKSNNVGLM